ncbi:thioredoxin domain-containing protein [Paenibacillus rhizoplanae]
MGNANAKVKIIEFADFKCPACKKSGRRQIGIV